MPLTVNPSRRVLMGPGPSEAHPRVLEALSRPLLGHLDPEFLSLMDRCRDLLRFVFQTKNELTCPMSGTGSSGMETLFANLVEPGDSVLVGVNGVFGGRMADVAARCGARVRAVESPWGRIIEPEDVKKAMEKERPSVFGLVHAETSTGCRQPVEEIAKICRDKGVLLLLDCVTSLGGLPVEIDAWGVDAAYSGTQKCLSAPPGLAPVTLGPRAVERMDRRKSKPQSWYLDLTMIRQYWGQERVYHHTAPISMIYALTEALALVEEEGLDARFERHKKVSEDLMGRLAGLGFTAFAQEGHRLPMLNAVALPEGWNDGELRGRLLKEHQIEVGGGLGEAKGKIWRVGLMGYSCRKENVDSLMAALESLKGTQTA